MLNRVIIVGRLTRDPDLRYSASGTAVARFTLAVNRTFKTQDGQEADFIQVVCFKKTAENTANFLKKGSLAGVDGRIQTGSYEDKDGKRVFTTEVVADNVQFLEPKGSGNSQNTERTEQPEASMPSSDDLPF